MKKIQGRGELTRRIEKKSEQLLGKAITMRELRFIVYLQYVLVNEQKVDPRKVNSEEKYMLDKWRSQGYIAGDDEHLLVSKEFWDAMSEIVYLGYVDLYRISVIPEGNGIMARLIKVGRNKTIRDVELPGKDPIAEAEAECRKYLMSSNVELHHVEGKGAGSLYEVVVGGMRTVGHVEFASKIHESSEEVIVSPIQPV